MRCILFSALLVTLLLHAAPVKADFGSCETCVFVIERIKKGTNMLLPSICAEIYEKYPTGNAYSFCHQTLNALSNNGNNVRYWLYEGCYKYEVYQAKEWVKPCPSHVMCSVLKNLKGEPFCVPMKMENPFATSTQSTSFKEKLPSGSGAVKARR